MNSSWPVHLCLILVSTAALNSAEEHTRTIDEARVKKLVTQLGSEDFNARELASAELRALGQGVVPLLKKGGETQDAEVRWRIRSLLVIFAPLDAEVHTPKIRIDAARSNSRGKEGVTVLTGSPRDHRYMTKSDNSRLLEGTESLLPITVWSWGSDVRYQWKQTDGPDLNLRPEDLAIRTVALRFYSPGKYTFQLTISDPDRASAPAFMEVEVEGTRDSESKSAPAEVVPAPRSESDSVESWN